MRKALFTASVLAVVAVVALTTPFAQAHQAGDVILRAGAINVDPREDSGDIYVGALSTDVPGAKGYPR